jgi:outer membrane protein assembly factor BamA
VAGQIGPPGPDVVGLDACVFDSDQDLPYWRAGALASFGIRLGRENRLSFQLHGEHIEAQLDERTDAAGRKCKNYPFLGYLRAGGSTLVSFSAQFERDTRDDFFLATSGMHLVVEVELASKALLFSDYEYSKYMLRYEHSFNFYWDHVWRFSIVAGLIQDVGERGSPFFERFFIGDYARFQIDKNSLPRNLALNFSTTTDYGDLLGSIEIEYDVPMWSTGTFFYRGYAYAALNFSVLTKADFLATDAEWSGRTKRPVTFDLGLKFETPIGLLTFSAGYVADLFL